MVKVLHFDATSEVVEKVIYGILQDKPLDVVSARKEGISYVNLEDRLPEYEVLVIHPGVRNQKLVIEGFGQRFPDLYIGVVTPGPNEYVIEERRGNVSLIGYKFGYPQDLADKIVGYIHRCSQREERLTLQL